MFGRVITAMATPFTRDGTLDTKRAAELAEFLVSNGTDALVLFGSTGESPTLSDAEKKELLRTVSDAVGSRADLIAGTGTYDTRHSIELSEMAESNGADGLLVVTPYYSRPPQSGLLAHFKAIASAVKLPIILYDIPIRTSRKIEHPTLLELAKVPNIVGVKDAASDIAGTARFAAEKPHDFLIWSGNDSDTLPILALGGYGVISVASHIVGLKIQELVAAYTKGEVQHAAAINHDLQPVSDVLFITSNPIPLKAALEMIGQPCGDPRLPLVPATEAERSQVRAVLQRMRLI